MAGSKNKDPDSVLRVALRCDELHGQGYSTEEIISKIVEEKHTKLDGTIFDRHRVLTTMFQLCSWYVPSKGKRRKEILESRKDIPAIDIHRFNRPKGIKITRRPRQTEKHILARYWVSFTLAIIYIITVGVIWFTR